jgi:hypothetical protein
MKVKKLIKKYFEALVTHNNSKQKDLYFKILRKSLKHKHTEVIG